MNHKEIVKETDRIAGNNIEAWNCVFHYLKEKENSKLNYSKVYECQNTLSWYIKPNACNEFFTYPFGFFFADYLNQLVSLKSKEAFIAYEKRMRRGASSEKEINATFDKNYRFFIWYFNENFSYDAVTDISDRELQSMYDRCCWLWEFIEEDVETLIHDLDYLKTNTVSLYSLQSIYLYIRRMAIRIWHLQLQSSCFDNHAKNEEMCATDIDIQDMVKENDEIISEKFVTKLIASQFRYMGYEALTLNDSTEVFCKKYDITNLLFLVAEDLMYFMLHQTTHTFNFCPECNCMFVTTHGNQKHCPACNLIIRQKKRKQNKARYLHKKITDYINNYRSGEIENASEIFRNESNYYWSVVQGKKPKRVKGYSAKIKTESDYMEWLEKKYEEIKAQK